MSFCSSCGSELEATAKYCPECGAGIAVAGSDSAPTSTRESLMERMAPHKRSIAIAAVTLAGLLIVGLGINAAVGSARRAAAAEANGQALAGGLLALNSNGQIITSMLEDLANPSSGYGAPYVCVGWAADFPDKMLVTIVWTSPEPRAMQLTFLPGDEAALAYVPNEVSPDTLDSSVKQWNASTDAHGHILLTGYESECEPAGAPSQSAPSGPTSAAGSTGSEQEAPAAEEVPEGEAVDRGNDWSDAYIGESMFLVIAASEDSKSAADEKLETVEGAAGDAGAFYYVDSSDHFDGLSPGLWIVYAPFSTKDDAANEVEWMKPRGLSPYMKQVTKQCDDRVLMNPLAP